MIRSLTIWISALLLLTSSFLYSQKLEFSADSAYSYTEHLAVTIGPRLMGSQNEQEALSWTAEKFRSFGADTAYVQWMYRSRRGVNTRSGTAVGVFPGSSDSIIVVGGHIDSDKFENPGASDNASGTACTIELARIWSKAPRKYTLVFAAFGAEESGLIGSKYFVKNFPDIDKVALMFSIDMAGSEGWLIPFIDIESHQTPQWLVKDAYAADDELGYNALEYPTHFFSWNSAMGGAGSDHMPFMEADIPAIDFTAGINIDPIHTSQDRIGYLKKPMLARSGRLVDALVSKYQQAGIPAGKKDHYMMLQTVLGNFFIPHWLLIGLVAIGLIVGILSILQARKFKQDIPKEKKARFSTLKVFLMTIALAIAFLSGEGIMQFIKGLRYPWLSPFENYMVLAALCMLAGGWVVLWLTRKWQFTADGYPYLLRAVILLMVLTISLSFLSIRLATYPAVVLLLISIIVNVNNPVIRFVLIAGSFWPMTKAIFIETLPFLARSISMTGFQMTTFVQAFFFSSILVLFLTVWFLPLFYLVAYGLRTIPFLQNFLEIFRKPVGGIVVLAIVSAYGGYVYSFPAYTEKWKAAVIARADYNITDGTDSLYVKGNEFLRNMRISGAGLDRAIDDEILIENFDLNISADWMDISGSDTLISGEKDTINANWIFTSEKPWLRVNFKVETNDDSLKIEAVNSKFNYYIEQGIVRFIWSAEPSDTLHFDAQFIVSKGATLDCELEGIYPFLPVDMKVESAQADVIYRTYVTLQHEAGKR